MSSLYNFFVLQGTQSVHRIKAFQSFSLTSYRAVMNRFGNLYEKFDKCGGPEALGALIVSFAFTRYAFGVQVCKGPSMIPTMRPEGELVVVNIWSHRRNTLYDVGDIVISKNKRDQNILVCKRVTAIAGDTVIFVDYNSGKLKSNVIDYGQVWLTGDNPLQSNDSRIYGQVPLSLLIGRVTCKFWYRPLHFRWADEVDPALASRELSPATYYAKSYNVSRGSSKHTEQDWKFLYSLLRDDERSSNLIPAERDMLLRLAESKIGKQTKLIKQSTEGSAEATAVSAIKTEVKSEEVSKQEAVHSESGKADDTSRG